MARLGIDRHGHVPHTGVPIALTHQLDRSPTTVTAEVRGEAPQLVPGFTWSVAARSEAPVERFIPEPER